MSIHKVAAGPWGCSDFDALATFLGAGDDTNVGGRNRYHNSYVVHRDATYIYAENGTTGELDFGGPSDEGTIVGTDARDVIQAAINATGTPNGKVYIKPGVYLLDGTITLPNFAQVYGPYSRRATEIGVDLLCGAVLQLEDNADTNMFENADPWPTGNVGIELNGLYLHMGTQTTGNAVNWSEVWRSAIRNCYFRGAGTTNRRAIYIRQASEANRIQGVMVEGAGITVDTSNATYIFDYEIANPERYGIEITSTNYANFVQQGYVYGDVGGIYGMYISNAERATITNNVVSGFDQDGIIFPRGLIDSVVTDNICLDNSQDPVNTHGGITLNTDIAANTTGNIIANNRCFDSVAVVGNKTQGYGIRVLSTFGADLTDENVVTDNNVLGNRTAGITVGTNVGPDNTINNNRGYNPVGIIANAFDTPNGRLEVIGAAATPTASTDYVVCHMDLKISSTDSGNTDCAIMLKDPAGANVLQATLSTIDHMYVPHGFQLNWGAFTGAAPTVTVAFV